MKEWAFQLVNNFGYLGIYILTMLESIFPIVPAEFILTLSGFATTFTKITKLGVILSATIGELTGSIILYFIGFCFNQNKLEHFTKSKIAKLMGIKMEDIEKSKEWFLNKGKYAVLFGRCIPVLGSLLSIPAGMAQMNIIIFILFTLVGISIWNTILVYFGITIQKSLDIILNNNNPLTKSLAYLFIASFIILILYIIYSKYKKNKKME